MRAGVNENCPQCGAKAKISSVACAQCGSPLRTGSPGASGSTGRWGTLEIPRSAVMAAAPPPPPPPAPCSAPGAASALAAADPGAAADPRLHRNVPGSAGGFACPAALVWAALTRDQAPWPSCRLAQPPRSARPRVRWLRSRGSCRRGRVRYRHAHDWGTVRQCRGRLSALARLGHAPALGGPVDDSLLPPALMDAPPPAPSPAARASALAGPSTGARDQGARARRLRPQAEAALRNAAIHGACDVAAARAHARARGAHAGAQTPGCAGRRGVAHARRGALRAARRCARRSRSPSTCA